MNDLTTSEQPNEAQLAVHWKEEESLQRCIGTGRW